jgi:hypothetical protein
MKTPPALLRPSQHLAEWGRRYPTMWREVDEGRAGGHWPAWCFLPFVEICRIWGLTIIGTKSVLKARKSLMRGPNGIA